MSPRGKPSIFKPLIRLVRELYATPHSCDPGFPTSFEGGPGLWYLQTEGVGWRKRED